MPKCQKASQHIILLIIKCNLAEEEPLTLLPGTVSSSRQKDAKKVLIDWMPLANNHAYAIHKQFAALCGHEYSTGVNI